MTGTLVLLAVIATMVIYLVVLELLERRPRELRGDWWSSFEQQFRAYARAHAAPGPPGEPRPRPRPGGLPPA